MAIYCGTCGHQRGYPMSSARTGGHTPCQFCGGEDKMQKKIKHPDPARAAKGDTKIKLVPLGNYSYPDHLLPDNPGNRNNMSQSQLAQ